MPETTPSEVRPQANADSNSARDHLANERTFLAWLRTGIALVVFRFAIGRFAIAIRQFMQFQGHDVKTVGLSAWFGAMAILAGVVVTFMGLHGYRRTQKQLETGNFEPAGFVIDLLGILVALFGLALAAYLIYIQLQL